LTGLTSTTTRTIIVSAPANDNTPIEAANDNRPPLELTGTSSSPS
jgi:hypothetical protein